MTTPDARPADGQLDSDLDDAAWDGRGIVYTPDGPIPGGDDWI
jgi:hypothetical protein